MHIVSRQPSEAGRSRMGALDVLPVFYDLNGKRVLVAGGEEPAAWKAELLAAAGAQVSVYASSFCSEMEALAEHAAVRLVTGDWRAADWNGVAIAVGDCEDEEAVDFVAVARAHGVPVNVIDKPTHCQFQFGAIVNRSPLVVGISTHGAAPILGQAVRRRIEVLLPATLSAWTKLAQAIRSQVLEHLAPGAERRALWESFVDLSFSGREPDEAIGSLISSAKGIGQGRVTLMGAGPGEAEHLTLKAVRALQSADVILFDDPVPDEVLELARREAKRIAVGKPRRESWRQEGISMMISLAEKKKHVVRLMSGDPMLLEWADEEIAALAARGVPVSVVPGISTARARATELDALLTRRSCGRLGPIMTTYGPDGRSNLG